MRVNAVFPNYRPANANEAKGIFFLVWDAEASIHNRITHRVESVTKQLYALPYISETAEVLLSIHDLFRRIDFFDGPKKKQ